MNRSRIVLGFIVAIGIWNSFALAGQVGLISVDYVPSNGNDTASRLKLSEARAELQRAWREKIRDGNKIRAYERGARVDGRGDYVLLREVEFKEAYLEIAPREGLPIKIFYVDLPKGFGSGTLRNGARGLPLSPNLAVVYDITWGDDDIIWARNSANALYILRESNFKQDSVFEDAVDYYRRAAPKPQLTEEARRFKVQAESAIREKRFSDAAERYAEALDVAPWWPEGRFNRALVLSEMSDFSGAVVEMKRYLLLLPDAIDARAVQDKIYEWEAKIKK